MYLHEFPVNAVLILLKINDYTGPFDQEKLVWYFQILIMLILHHKNNFFGWKRDRNLRGKTIRQKDLAIQGSDV